MKGKNWFSSVVFFILVVAILYAKNAFSQKVGNDRPRIIVTTDGEIDDECSIVRFLLYANEFDIEGIITSSSQYHWQGHEWAGDEWIKPYLAAYKQVYPNLVKHDPNFPTPAFLSTKTSMGNMGVEGEMDKITDGSQLIANVLLDETDKRPVWIQAWGGINTISRALKTIEEEHPGQMAEVASKIRLYLIFEQDSTFQSYIQPHWGKYKITTIISDQFEVLAYHWKKLQPEKNQLYFDGQWMKENILENHGPLCSLYKAHKAGDKGFVKGDFRSEGDSPAFLHNIDTGLRNMESPDWGGWGGRYVWVRNNTWLDPAPYKGYVYPKGRYFRETCWGRLNINKGETSRTNEHMMNFFKPIWRWSEALQNDFAARADWCIKSYKDANHSPVVKLSNAIDIKTKPGSKIQLSANGTIDPDGDQLSYTWWEYKEADTYGGTIDIQNNNQKEASFIAPEDASSGETIHVICEVKDDGTPQLTRYQRVVITIE